MSPFTIFGMSPFTLLAHLLAIVGFLFAGQHWFRYVFRTKINLVAFHQQIRKLVMANNIDRAIKLCNAEPHAVAPKAVKMLLTRANRPYALNLVWHQLQLEVIRGVDRQWSMWRPWSLLFVVALASLSFGMLSLVPDEEAFQAGVSLAGVFCGYVWYEGTRSMIHDHLLGCRCVCLDIRNMLYARSEYVPPHDRPLRKMTAEEIERWKRGMEYIEDEARKAGPGTATDLHDAAVEDDGRVLPPL